MKAFIVLAMCLVAARAVPNSYYAASPELRVPAYASVERHELKSKAHPFIPIVKMVHDTDNKGGYNLDFHSGDGSKVQTRGVLRDLGGTEGPVSVQSGSYSFVGTDGKTYTVNWTADENGFRATGDHLPTPPPLPEAIARSIDFASLPPDHHLVLQRKGSFGRGF